MSNSSAARQRIEKLLDANSFVEIGAGVHARATDFNPRPAEASSDGVITGYGLIEDSLVYVYSQDASVLGGSIGEMHARKIIRIYDMAIKTGAPVIGLIDSAGLRLQEGMDALDAVAGIYARQAAASGLIPQISAVFGRCGGGLAVAASMCDFTLMESGAHLFVNAPNTLAGNREESNDTSSASSRAAAGVADYTGTEDEVLGKIRELVDILPCNYEDIAEGESEDDLNRGCTGIAAGADPAAIMKEAADDGVFVEIRSAFAPDMTAGLARLGGTTVGVIGNRSPLLTADGCTKAADLVRFCDAFGIPVISLTNATGFAAAIGEENREGSAAAALTMALARASVPKINVITKQSMGSAYAVMNAKATGADLTFAFPGAVIGIMDAAMAARVMVPGADKLTFEETRQRYAETQCSLAGAAARGLVDSVVEPADLRRYLIGALEVLYTKRVDTPAGKHISHC